jgi:hypothetical protein
VEQGPIDTLRRRRRGVSLVEKRVRGDWAKSRSRFLSAALEGSSPREQPAVGVLNTRLVATGLSEGSKPRNCGLSSRPPHFGVWVYRRANGTWVLPSRKRPVTFQEFLAVRRVFNTQTAGCSLGLDPSRVSGKSLDRDFAQSPLTRFSVRLTPHRRRLRVSIGLCSTSSARLTEAIRVRIRDPHRVSAPSQS